SLQTKWPTTPLCETWRSSARQRRQFQRTSGSAIPKLAGEGSRVYGTSWRMLTSLSTTPLFGRSCAPMLLRCWSCWKESSRSWHDRTPHPPRQWVDWCQLMKVIVPKHQIEIVSVTSIEVRRAAMEQFRDLLRQAEGQHKPTEHVWQAFF